MAMIIICKLLIAVQMRGLKLLGLLLLARCVCMYLSLWVTELACASRHQRIVVHLVGVLHTYIHQCMHADRCIVIHEGLT